MEVKKFVYNGLLFLTISLSVFLLLFYTLFRIKKGNTSIIYRTSEIYYWKGGNTYQKFRDFDTNQIFDACVIGSSHAYRGYDPRNFKKHGLKVFNLGSSAQTPLNSYWIIRNYIHSNCKLMIIDVDDGALSTDGFEASADLIQNISSDKAALQMATCYDNPQILNMMLLRKLNVNQPPAYVDSFYVGNGFSENRDSIKVNLPAENYYSFYHPNEKQLDYLEKIILDLQSKHISIIIVTHPSPKERSKAVHEQYLRILNPLFKKHGVLYLDYSFEHDFDSHNYFFDSNHLNQTGVNAFNEILIRDLKNKKLIN
jgi:hypothetical protein